MLFFCISGYLIVSTLVKHGDVKRFAINRIARIYPLFLILHLIMFTAGPLAGYEWMGDLRHDPLAYAGHFLSNLFFLPGMVDLPIAQKNAWSLSYEAAFYIVAGICFTGIHRWRETSGRIIAVLGAACAAAALIYYPTTIFFAAGTLAWWLEKRGRLSWPNTGPLSLVCVLAGLVTFSQGQVWLTALLVLPFFCDVVRQQGWVSRFFQLPPVVWLGMVSYSLYLTHPFILSPLQRIAMKLAPTLGNTTAYVLFLVSAGTLALVAAAVSYALIEVRLTRRLLPPRSSSAAK